ncbi:MAG TPA: hypothetical protein VH721_06800 [Gaiellaceae bacterium]|jgi:hypothetical protein
MPRKHLFVIVALLGAAVVAGLLAVTRTTALGTAASSATKAQITAKSRSLDRLEASLRQALAKTTPAATSRGGAAATSVAPRTVYVRAGAPSAAPGGEHEDDHGEHAFEHEERGESD